MSENLTPYAVSQALSQGRKFAQAKHPYRDEFDRDRDRIIHSSAFRRLKGKTQVFAPDINDFYHTRLTHTMEVAQIGRTIAKALGVNEALTEAICLGHDLGHSPFGHSGEKALNRLMADFGGFEHNAQTLRLVDLLERPYPDFAGLNLMYETRLGLAKHRTSYDDPAKNDFAQKCCSLEGQIADTSDRIAYNCHDLEDGMHAGLITAEKISGIEVCVLAGEKCNADDICDSYIRNTRIAKTIIDILVSDCIETSRDRINSRGIASLDDIYSSDENIICVSTGAEKELAELEKFLLSNMYEHPDIRPIGRQVDAWLEKLFMRFCDMPSLMPGYYQGFIEQFGLERAVCDYISGMTDRYCLKTIKKD
ncbi:MAG: dNTP triphosphohydrolase [Anaerohalosphaeraceae bacterium]|nr:dNTP triphosphohydrolase [Anaerohalosphaeraceae bacterium]